MTIGSRAVTADFNRFFARLSFRASVLESEFPLLDKPGRMLLNCSPTI